MTVSYTWDVFSTLDGYGSYEMAPGDLEWGGYWGKQGPELLVRRLKEESDVPLRSQASLSLNWSLLAAGLVDRVQVTVFPVISGRTGVSPIFDGLGDFDLDLLESHTLDGRTIELNYRPHPR